MKEYNVVRIKMGFGNLVEKVETLLNLHARDGWILNKANPSLTMFILERNKNR